MAVETWLRLALAADVGPVLGHRLLRAFATPQAIFDAAERQLKEVSGLGPARISRLMDPAAAHLAREELELTETAGVNLLTPADVDYPPLLLRLEYPPLVLWVRGRLAPSDRLAIALVGPRNPSAYGRLMTRLVAPPLAAHGLTLVSGMAYGVDAEAHKAALDAGGRTLAVLGQGLGTPVYPQTNQPLAEQIVQQGQGALLSVFPMRTEPNPGNFPARNEIIAGLSLGTLVVEASPTSGALITARHAAAAGRVVMACPGDANRRSAQGSNRLLGDGAVLIQTSEDVLAALAQEIRREREAMDFEAGGAGETATGDAAGERDDSKASGNNENPEKGGAALALHLAGLDPASREVLTLLGDEPLPADVILERCQELGHTAPALHSALLRLEMDGLVYQMPGRLYALAHPSWR